RRRSRIHVRSLQHSPLPSGGEGVRGGLGVRGRWQSVSQPPHPCPPPGGERGEDSNGRRNLALPDQQFVASILADFPFAQLGGAIQWGAGFGLHDDQRIFGDLALQRLDRGQEVVGFLRQIDKG